MSQTRTRAAAHELTALTTGGTTSPLSYDSKGNLLSRPAALASPALGLVWDFDNRLRGADTNGTPATQEVTFEYDALGRRVARSEAGNNVVYVHAGQQVIADYARGAAAAAPSFRYVYGSYVDEPLLRHAGTGTTLPTSGTAALYYHRNQQYSIVGLSDAAGTLVERYAYTAYGELTILAPDRTARTTSSFENRYTYTAREWDPTLRLYYFRARWLEPKAGRFIGRDPLGYVDGMGLYGAYLGLRGVDPYGSKVLLVLVKALAAPDDPNADPFVDIVQGAFGGDPQAWMEDAREFVSANFKKGKKYVDQIPDEETFSKHKEKFLFNGKEFKGTLREYQSAVSRETVSKREYFGEATYRRIENYLVDYATNEQQNSKEYDEIVLFIHGSKDRLFAFGKERLGMDKVAAELATKIYGTGFRGKFKILSCYYNTENECTLNIVKADAIPTVDEKNFSVVQNANKKEYCTDLDVKAASIKGVARNQGKDSFSFDIPEPRPSPLQPKK